MDIVSKAGAVWSGVVRSENGDVGTFAEGDFTDEGDEMRLGSVVFTYGVLETSACSIEIPQGNKTELFLCGEGLQGLLDIKLCLAIGIDGLLGCFLCDGKLIGGAIGGAALSGCIKGSPSTTGMWWLSSWVDPQLRYQV